MSLARDDHNATAKGVAGREAPGRGSGVETDPSAAESRVPLVDFLGRRMGRARRASDASSSSPADPPSLAPARRVIDQGASTSYPLQAS
jgi:hypothetical protein